MEAKWEYWNGATAGEIDGVVGDEAGAINESVPTSPYSLERWLLKS
jgi:hypothetical protein